jgi:hypothetical protein
MHRGEVTFTISRSSLILYIMLVMAIIGFFSFVEVGETQERLIDPVIGVFLMLVLMFIMMASWLTRD